MRVLVSGGTRGIGRACVEYFTARGDQVAFLYRQNRDLAEELSRRTGALGFCADVGDPDSVRVVLSSAIAALGGLDAVINNAGVAQIKLFTDLTDTDWQRMVNTNLSGAFYVTREAVRPMIAQKHGRVIFIEIGRAHV